MLVQIYTYRLGESDEKLLPGMPIFNDQKTKVVGFVAEKTDLVVRICFFKPQVVIESANILDFQEELLPGQSENLFAAALLASEKMADEWIRLPLGIIDN